MLVDRLNAQFLDIGEMDDLQESTTRKATAPKS